ncbi:MAG: hypothetical protein DID90_2727553352 [Candidatus Nitrotoga sp. LAW]|nr:MAG: hypothetical protein DID90_2727553352 [Candidatus Nitrotoga sp. LAW]
MRTFSQIEISSNSRLKREKIYFRTIMIKLNTLGVHKLDLHFFRECLELSGMLGTYQLTLSKRRIQLDLLHFGFGLDN